MYMDGANDLIRVTTDASADIECQASWAHNDAGTITVGRTNTASITGATTTTIVAAPGASKQRSIRHLNIRNNHGSTACTVTVDHTDGTNAEIVFKTVLAAGEMIVYGENGIWVYYDPAGKPYMGLGPIATQAEMEAGTSLTTVVTPGRQHNHPSACKFWVDTSPGNVNNASYNVTSVLDTTAGITVITIATDFSSANWACHATVESTSDTMTVTNLKFARVGLADQAAGTVSIECHDMTAITAVIEDPTSWYICGFGDHA
jgi:hypothetical protein